MNYKTYLITGGSGTGKSTLIPHLTAALNKNEFEIHDFDERGVPADADAQWRIEETKHWLLVGAKNSEEGKNTIICGLTRPSEINEIVKGLELNNVEVCLLNTNPEVLRSRLLGRYQTGRSREEAMTTSGKEFETFVDHSMHFASLLEKEASELGYRVIDTTERTPEEVSKEVADLLTRQ